MKKIISFIALAVMVLGGVAQVEAAKKDVNIPAAKITSVIKILRSAPQGTEKWDIYYPKYNYTLRYCACKVVLCLFLHNIYISSGTCAVQ